MAHREAVLRVNVGNMATDKTTLQLSELQDIVRLTLHAVPGCAHIQSVKIVRDVAVRWKAPNWDVTEILPPVPEQAGLLVCKAIEQLRQKFDLASVR